MLESLQRFSPRKHLDAQTTSSDTFRWGGAKLLPKWWSSSPYLQGWAWIPHKGNPGSHYCIHIPWQEVRWGFQLNPIFTTTIWSNVVITTVEVLNCRSFIRLITHQKCCRLKYVVSLNLIHNNYSKITHLITIHMHSTQTVLTSPWTWECYTRYCYSFYHYNRPKTCKLG